MTKDVYVVPHSHWDAEWYFTCEDSQILLLENWRHLMSLLEEDERFPCYVFDGLSMPVDDYLEIRPQEHDRIARLVEQRKLQVGPWYTQTDTLLVRTESVLRNLICGTRIARGLSHCMNIGYLPDIFGQHAYLPSFFRSLGLDYSVLQRGLYTDQIEHDLNFWWRSPDGERIATSCMYFGYGPGKFLSNDDAYVEHRLLPILDKLAKMNESTDKILLPSGGDQVFANPEFPDTVEQLNERGLDYRFRMASYEQYMEDAWKDNSFENVIDGELIACQKSRIHRTCHSTRVDMKQQTHRTEHLLLDVLEPLCAIAKTLGIEYPADLMEHLWKKVFASHAHNGIEASNADQVNRNVKNRLQSVERSADALIGLLKKRIAYAVSNGMGTKNVLVCFHLDTHTEDVPVEAVVFTQKPQFAIELNGEAHGYTVLEQDELMGGQIVVVTAAGEQLQDVDDYYRTKILLDPINFAGVGYRALTVTEDVQGACDTFVAFEGSSIENESFEIGVKDGALYLRDKQTGRTVEDVMAFYDDADFGDEFDFAPLVGDIPRFSSPFELLDIAVSEREARLRVVSKIELARDVESRKEGDRSLAMSIETTLALRSGERFVRVTHRLNNAACDHRLRVRLRTPFTDIERSYADQGFSVIDRPCHTHYLDAWRELGFVEKPMPIYTMENTAFVRDGASSFGVITQGIKEYEVTEEKNLDVTLYRSVGLLGRDDTAWRPGRASGINNKVVETPDAQMLGELELDYALWMGEGISDVQLFSMIDEYRGVTCSYQVQGLNTFEERLERFGLTMPAFDAPARCDVIGFDNASMFMSSFKPVDEGEGVIVRLFNPSDCPTSCMVPTGWRATACNVLEEELEELKGTIELAPKAYLTVKLLEVTGE